MALNYELRKATLNDLEFAFDLTKQTSKWFIEKMRPWNEDKEKTILTDYLKDFISNIYIITVDNCDIGLLGYRKMSSVITLDEILILPEYHNQGIGSDIINRLVDKNGHVSLMVYKENRAKELYQRLGFSIYGEANGYYLMEKIKEREKILIK